MFQWQWAGNEGQGRPTALVRPAEVCVLPCSTSRLPPPGRPRTASWHLWWPPPTVAQQVCNRCEAWGTCGVAHCSSLQTSTVAVAPRPAQASSPPSHPFQVKLPPFSRNGRPPEHLFQAQAVAGPTATAGGRERPMVCKQHLWNLTAGESSRQQSPAMVVVPGKSPAGLPSSNPTQAQTPERQEFMFWGPRKSRAECDLHSRNLYKIPNSKESLHPRASRKS